MSSSCGPVDCSLPSSSVHGISQVRILEWVAISFSRESSLTQGSSLCLLQVYSFPLHHQGSPRVCICETKMYVKYCVPAKLLQSCPTLCNPMDCTCQAPLSMGFYRQEYWSGLPWCSPADLPNPGIEPMSPCLLPWQAGSLPLVPPGKHEVKQVVVRNIRKNEAGDGERGDGDREVQGGLSVKMTVDQRNIYLRE